MTHQLKVLGVALGVVFAVGAVGASVASATVVDVGTDAGLWTSNVSATETTKGDGEQTAPGKDTFTINGLTATCTTVTMKGQNLTKGPSSTEATGEPTYAGCHVVVAGITKTVTVTVNGCAYVFNALTTTTEDNVTHVKTFDRAATATIECPKEKQIEIHIYNEKEAELTTLCTYDIKPQGPLSGISITNKVNTPTSANDVIGSINMTIAMTNTKLSVLCGEKEAITAVYKGEDTLRATNEAGEFVDASISD